MSRASATSSPGALPRRRRSRARQGEPLKRHRRDPPARDRHRDQPDPDHRGDLDVALAEGEGHERRFPVRLGRRHRGRGHGFTLLSSVLPQGRRRSNPIRGGIQIGLGVGLLLIAVRQWRRRPSGETSAALPKWMSAIDTMNAGRVSASDSCCRRSTRRTSCLAQAPESSSAGRDPRPGRCRRDRVFTLIAAASVAIPVIAYLVASKDGGAARVPARVARAQERDSDDRPASRDRFRDDRQGTRKLLGIPDGGRPASVGMCPT